MALSSHLSLALNGNIRLTSAPETTYPVSALHSQLLTLLALPVNLLLGPLGTWADNKLTLLSPFNIDDAVAGVLYGGAVQQAAGNTLYAGLRLLVAEIEGGFQVEIRQGNTLLGAYSGQGEVFRGLLKVRSEGADIADKKVRIKVSKPGFLLPEKTVQLGDAEVEVSNQLTGSSWAGREIRPGYISGWRGMYNINSTCAQ